MYRKFIPPGINLKIFVKETNSENPPAKTNNNIKYLPVHSLTGEKAKEFYEEILKESSLPPKGRKQVVKLKQNGQPTSKPQNKAFKNKDLLWMAQNNDIKKMQIFFSQNKNDDVNIVDDFGWTPLMCASCSGAQDAVSLLLENGADPERTDRLGQTALSLAQKKNQYKIVKILEEPKFKPKIPGDKEVSENSKSEIFFCSTCKGNFKTNKNTHESSTVHLLNCPIKTTTFYGIPESNKGFQLLLREGWDKEKGLGRDGAGRKFPIKAVMKKDRTGVGATPLERPLKRESQEQNENKRIKLYKKWKQKNFEKNFRLEFS